MFFVDDYANARINIDRIIAVDYNSNGATVYLTGGIKRHIKGSLALELAELLENWGPVVPAAPGFFQLRFHFHGETPSVAAVLDPCWREPIVAWRVGCDGAVPVTTDIFKTVSSFPVMEAILYPDGSVAASGEGSWKDIDEWAAYVCEKWTEWYDEEEKSDAA